MAFFRIHPYICFTRFQNMFFEIILLRVLHGCVMQRYSFDTSLISLSVIEHLMAPSVHLKKMARFLHRLLEITTVSAS